MPKEILTQARLKELLHYDPETGLFTWKLSRGCIAKGAVASCLNRHSGYRQIRVDNKNYQQHRLAFLYMTGCMPKEVDHLNHVKHDNAWINLRSADRAINNRNASRRKDNISGITGVHFHKVNKRWVVKVCNEYIGIYETKEEAIQMSKSKHTEHGFHENHGR